MLQLRGCPNGLQAADETALPPQSISLGRWKLTGEICDGKCLSGVMRLGRGLAHKARKNLSLLGAVPPVIVSIQPISSEEFLLITGPKGTELPQVACDHVVQFISFEGEVTKHGSLLVFAIDAHIMELAQ